MTRLTSATARLAAIPGTLWSGYRRHAAERAAIARLSGMSDRILKDIGLHRSGIRDAVRHGLDRW